MSILRRLHGSLPVPLTPVLDCCDGSDEQGACTNTCLEKSAAKKQALLEELAEYAASLAKKVSGAPGEHDMNCL